MRSSKQTKYQIVFIPLSAFSTEVININFTGCKHLLGILAPPSCPSWTFKKSFCSSTRKARTIQDSCILLFIGFFSTEMFNISLTVSKHLLGLFAPTTLRLKDFHDNLLLFNEEGSNNSFSDAFVATRSTIRSGHTLQALGHSAALEWP